ncbi:hypothetical protein CYANOKiyG1_09400 [Okeania sp. KiyG1]|nr:hypothetical protein CYANOKiyG1_09400 [Okeania sp. KiyG1]
MNPGNVLLLTGCKLRNYHKSELEKRLMKQFNIQWAYADSIATEARTCLNQLKTAKKTIILN